jgi:CheY-like chemotaxis protein
MPKILVVEDDADNVEIVTRFLRKQNHEVIIAYDGPTGVRLAVSEKPDLILMDERLPNDGDGQKATREIRARPELETTPIIALTAKCMPQDMQEFKTAGCTAIVKKPFDFQVLSQTIASLLSPGTRT